MILNIISIVKDLIKISDKKNKERLVLENKRTTSTKKEYSISVLENIDNIEKFKYSSSKITKEVWSYHRISSKKDNFLKVLFENFYNDLFNEKIVKTIIDKIFNTTNKDVLQIKTDKFNMKIFRSEKGIVNFIQRKSDFQVIVVMKTFDMELLGYSYCDSFHMCFIDDLFNCCGREELSTEHIGRRVKEFLKGEIVVCRKQ